MDETPNRQAQSRHCIQDAWRRIVSVSLASALGTWIGIGSLLFAQAEESSPKPQKSESSQSVHQETDRSAPSEPDAATEPKSEGAPSVLGTMPPFLRPKLSPEELEEAERLRKLAAKYGTDPTAIVGRMQLSSQYADLARGARLSDTVARVDVPFRGNWLLRVDTPFHRWIDPNSPGTTSQQGLGDLSAILGWRAYNTPEYAIFIGAVSSYPTASENFLGTGKYTAGPIIATGRFLPHWESFLFGTLQQSFSVGGDPSRADVSLTSASLQINTIWVERWWSTITGAWAIDWEREAKSSMTIEFEVGRNLVGRWGVYLRPGIGVWGRDVIGAYEWNVEIGTRYMFKSF